MHFPVTVLWERCHGNSGLCPASLGRAAGAQPALNRARSPVVGITFPERLGCRQGCLENISVLPLKFTRSPKGRRGLFFPRMLFARGVFLGLGSARSPEGMPVLVLQDRSIRMVFAPLRCFI